MVSSSHENSSRVREVPGKKFAVQPRPQVHARLYIQFLTVAIKPLLINRFHQSA
jgi:hypothetical protein